MVKKLEKDLELINEAMDSFVQAMSRHRTWETIASRAGISIDRAGATMLHFLDQQGADGVHLNEMAHRLGIEAPSVTRKVQQLEQKGLVRRIPDTADRRAFVLEITKSGRDIIKRLHQTKREIFAEILAGWPADERHDFAQLFHKLSQDLSSYREINGKANKSKEADER